jgi:hypothetical protein
MLIWHKELWLIDHGASLYFSSWTNWEKHAQSRLNQRPRIVAASVSVLKRKIPLSNNY